MVKEIQILQDKANKIAWDFWKKDKPRDVASLLESNARLYMKGVYDLAEALDMMNQFNWTDMKEAFMDGVDAEYNSNANGHLGWIKFKSTYLSEKVKERPRHSNFD